MIRSKEDGIRIGIDATNLNFGGGRSHILNILKTLDIDNHNISKIIIWGNNDLLSKLSDYSWLEKKTHKYLNTWLIYRYFWIYFFSVKEFKENIDILFAPSGLYYGRFRPYIAMSRNMMLFDKEQLRSQKGLLKIKLFLSRIMNTKSMKNALGTIFISKYAQDIISKELSLNNDNTIKINHGISESFKCNPNNRDYSCKSGRLKLLYVSHVYSYKHHWNVVEAVSKLRKEGFDLSLTLIGGGNDLDILRLKNSINVFDQRGDFVTYLGNQPYEEIHEFYKSSDIFVYASTCENMPNILLEAMSSSLPIACSDHLPMPEFLSDAGIYFDSLNIDSICNSLRKFLISEDLRASKGKLAFSYSEKYSWKKTSLETFNFIEEMIGNNILENGINK